MENPQKTDCATCKNAGSFLKLGSQNYYCKIMCRIFDLDEKEFISGCTMKDEMTEAQLLQSICTEKD